MNEKIISTPQVLKPKSQGFFLPEKVKIAETKENCESNLKKNFQTETG